MLPLGFLLLALAAFIKPSVPMITLIIAATAWMEVARVVQNQVRSLRERDFAIAALMIGASDATIMFRELVPNVVGAIVVAATLDRRPGDPVGILHRTGYGIQPPMASWGNMLNNAQQYLGSAPGSPSTPA